MQKKPEISAVQHGNRRVEYRAARSVVGWLRFFGAAAIGAGWTLAVASLAFSVGVDRGNNIANDACRAGDVYVDPAVSEGMD